MLISSFDEEDIENAVLGDSAMNNVTSTRTNFDSNVEISANGNKVYYIVLWVNEIGNEQEGYSQLFFGDVSFTASNGMGITASFS